MILAVDIGNTAIKLAVVDDVTVYDLMRTSQDNFISHVAGIQSNYPQLKDACVCQVGTIDIKLLHALEGLLNVTYINQETVLPFFNKYQSATLGNDRKALVAGAMHIAPSGKEILVIDAGTCVTYDFMDADHNYWGGGISPGFNLRYHSLHNFTAQLPLLKPQKPSALVGNSTVEAIHSGVVNGLSFEVKGVIKKYSKKHPNLYVIITGGDAELLVKQLKNRFFASPFLMLYGIHNLYKLNS